MENAKQQTGVPENAFRELKKGEQYEPLMSPDRTYKEVTVWSVLWGVLMAVVFSAASAYLGLKVGQVFEAAIPITIIAIGVTGATHRKGALGENVIIQSIGACGRSHIHLARPLYPARQISGNDGELHRSVHRLRVGRSLGHPFPHPFPQVFRERHARQISFSRSHGLHAGIGFRGKRWQPGFTAPRGRSRRRHLRFHHRHRRLVERKRHVTLSGMGASVGGQDQTRL